MSHLPLFSDAPPSPRDVLARRLASLARAHIYLGASSWKYEGWIGQIYTRERYLHHQRFSQKRFEAHCLAEYAEIFPIVGGDFSFYQFPTPAYWQRLFASAPSSLLFGLKVPEEITVKIWPKHARYGARAGQENPNFLDADLFTRLFVEPLRPFHPQVAVLIFEFGTFAKQSFPSVYPFLDRLDAFLHRLPPDFRYSIEIRNPEYLDTPYLQCLARHRVAHVFNAWTRMPELAAQMQIPGVDTAPFWVVRALLRRGRTYEQAVQAFSPYDRLQEENLPARQALRSLITRARAEQRPTYIFVNNRFEGNAPGTILAVTENLDHGSLPR